MQGCHLAPEDYRKKIVSWRIVTIPLSSLRIISQNLVRWPEDMVKCKKDFLVGPILVARMASTWLT
jgi:hypothetical protein